MTCFAPSLPPPSLNLFSRKITDCLSQDPDAVGIYAFQLPWKDISLLKWQMQQEGQGGQAFFDSDSNSLEV